MRNGAADRFAFEWGENILIRGGLQPTPDGFRRFATDPEEHVRRLTSHELSQSMSSVGIHTKITYFRAHLFTRPCALAHRIFPGLLHPLARIAYLDWQLFKTLPNGATMVSVGVKTES